MISQLWHHLNCHLTSLFSSPSSYWKAPTRPDGLFLPLVLCTVSVSIVPRKQSGWRAPVTETPLNSAHSSPDFFRVSDRGDHFPHPLASEAPSPVATSFHLTCSFLFLLPFHYVGVSQSWSLARCLSNTPSLYWVISAILWLQASVIR